MPAGVYRRGATWTYVVELPRGPDGKRRQESRGGFRTMRDAQTARRARLDELASGASRIDRRVTLAAYLDHWREHAPHIEPSTQIAYAGALQRVTTLPADAPLGSVPLADLSVAHIRRWQAAALARYAPTTVALSHRVLRAALNDAVEWELVRRNVAARVPAPAYVTRVDDPWTPDELRAFLDAAADDPDWPLWRTIATSCLRMSEVRALRWADVDLDARVATVRQHVSRRVDDRNAIAQGAKRGAGRHIELSDAEVAALRAQLDAQRFARARYGRAWRETGLVFTSPDGGMLSDRTINARFRRVCARARVRDADGTERPLRQIRFHDLRHTAATIMLQRGVPVHVVSQRLGHASPSITLRVYAHVMPSAQRDAIDRMERALYHEGDSHARDA